MASSQGRRARRSSAKEEFWRGILEGWRRSGGVSIREWCLRLGVSEPSFYAWRRELARREKPATPAFLPLDITPSVPDAPAPLEIELPSGARLHVRSGCEPALLQQALLALRGSQREEEAC